MIFVGGVTDFAEFVPIAQTPQEQAAQAATRGVTGRSNIRHINWGSEVRKRWGEEYNERETAYEFGERKLKDSGPHSGIYDLDE